MRACLAILASVVAAACGTVDYDALPPAQFTGTLHVVWVGEGDDFTGDGLFVYVPDPADPLRLVRGNPEATVPVIEPSMIYTDGGSIPRPATLFQGFSPWGYGPAYIIHDWLFVARHCLNDGRTDAVYAPYAGMSFQESAEVIAEAIKALVAQDRVQPRQVAPRVISGAVAGPVSYARWRETGLCEDHAVPEDVLERARFGIPGARVPRSMLLTRETEDGRLVRVPPGRTVATFSF